MADSSSTDPSCKMQNHSAAENVIIGPSLPPDFSSKKKEVNVPFGPALPPKLHNSNSNCIGPALPPHMCKDSPSKLDLENDSTSTGPTVLPHTSNERVQKGPEDSSRIMGPALPPHLRRHLQNQNEEISAEDTADNEDDDIYGPMPEGTSKKSLAETALEERALQLRIGRLDPEVAKEPVRESWMTELPAAKAADFGLGPRQFKNRPGPDMSDRSSWTDIPGEKGKPKNKPSEVDLKTEAELRELQKRDKEQELLTKKHKRKSKSLVEMHQEKIKKTSEASSVNERRPFSRDIDLQVNRFDDAQKKAVLKKAQLLDDRFSSGKSKFL